MGGHVVGEAGPWFLDHPLATREGCLSHGVAYLGSEEWEVSVGRVYRHIKRANRT